MLWRDVPFAVADEASLKMRKFRPRIVGGGTCVLVLLCAFTLVSWVVAMIFDVLVTRFNLPLDLVGVKKIVEISFVLSSGFAFAALVTAISSKFRKYPPPSWKVVDELKLYLESLSLLPENVDMWRYCLKYHRPRFDRKTSALTMWFWVRSDKATESRFSGANKGQSFQGAQDVEIKKYYDRRNRWTGFTLCIWYENEEKIFERLFRQVKK